MEFTKAVRRKKKLRMCLQGPSGSGKSLTADKIANYLVPGGRVAVIDTENGSASLYSGEAGVPEGDRFQTLELSETSPSNYIEALDLAAANNFDVVIVDSGSHVWMGPGGVLEIVEVATKKSSSKNSYTAGWGTGTPEYNRFMNALLKAPYHLIMTLRTNTEYNVSKDEKGKTKVEKIGTAPIIRKNSEFEFDVVGELDLENNLFFDKTRCSALKDKMFNKAGKEVAEILKGWLNEGDEPIAEPSQQELLLKRLNDVSSKPELELILKDIVEVKKTGVLSDAENKVLLKAYKKAEERLG